MKYLNLYYDIDTPDDKTIDFTLYDSKEEAALHAMDGMAEDEKEYMRFETIEATYEILVKIVKYSAGFEETVYWSEVMAY